MGKRVVAQIRHRATGLFHHIVGCRCACRHHVAGKVGNGGQKRVLLHLCFGKLLGHALLALLERSHRSLCLLGLLALALLHKGAYRCGRAVELGGEIIVFKLEGAALFVELQHFCNRLLPVEALDGKARDGAGRIRFYLLKSKHYIY